MCYISVYLKQGYRELPHATYKPRICHDNSNAPVSYPIRRHRLSVSSFKSHPFLAYVLSYGFCHLAHVGPRNTTVLHAVEALQSVVQHYSSEWERLYKKSDYFVPWPTLKHDFVLYILIAFAPEPLLRLHIGRPGTKLRLKDGTNPLIYAAHFRKVVHARTLLSRGVNPNRSGWGVVGFRQLSPLEVAVEYGDRAMVTLFLTEGGPVPHDLFVSVLERPVCDFPASNVATLLQTDEFAEWIADARDEELLLRALNPIQYRLGGYPSEQDIDIIQRRLLQIGCDPSTRLDEKSLISASACVGHISTVKQILSLSIPLPPSILLDASTNPENPEMIHFLLSIGCNVDVASPVGDTPLHLVCDMPWTSELEDDCLKSVQVLIDAGCNPSACNQAGNTPLHLAARHGYTSVLQCFLLLPVVLPHDILLVASESHTRSTIQLLVDKGADVHAISANRDTPLHIALDTRFGDTGGKCLERAEILINAGCNPCSPNSHGKLPIDIAAKHGHLRVVEHLLSMNLLWSPNVLLSVSGSVSPNATLMTKFLVNKGANVHVTRPNGDTLLHLAIKHLWEPDCLKRVQMLVSAGCNARACNLAGETPFHVAAMRGYISVMEYLLSLGIMVLSDAMLTQFEGFLHLSGSYITTCFLLDEGGDIHTTAANGDTLLHLAATFYPEYDALELIKYLVHAGCCPSILNSAQETPLHIAARSGYISVIEYLLSLDIPLPRDIVLAASTGKEHSKKAHTIRYVFDKGASVSAVTPDGNTALHLLLAQGNDCLESVKILIDAGCDPCSQNLAGETPLHIAARSAFTTVVEYLLSREVPLPHNILLISAPSTIRFLLEKDIELPSAAASGPGCTGLICHTLRSLHQDSDCQAFVGLLIDSGWDFSGGLVGETPIHVAAKRGHILTIKYLCLQNVPLPPDVLLAAVDNESQCTHNVVPLVRFLIHGGAPVNITNSNGDTPLHLALRCKSILNEDSRYDHLRSWKVVETLLDSGSDPFARNVDGKTPFDIAEANGRFFKENFLRLAGRSNPN